MLKNNNKSPLTDIESQIIRELIRNTRSSDSQIAKKTGIPVMTVNRKRKQLEEKNYIRYYTSIDKGEFGLKIFGAKQLYIIKFKIGITRKKYFDDVENDIRWRTLNCKFISMTYLGEKDGHLALVIILDAVDESHLVEEFNGNIVPYLGKKLGNDAIEDISTVSLNKLIRIHHNYMPHANLGKGKLKDDWPDDMIFVNEVNGFCKDEQKLDKVNKNL